MPVPAHELDTEEPMSKSQAPSGGSTSERSATTTDRSIREAHVLFSDADLEAVGIAELVSVWRSSRLRHVEMLACKGNDAVVQISVERPLDDTRLSSLEYVGRWEFVSDDGDTRREYIIELTAPEFPPNLAEQVDGLIDAWYNEVSEHGITMVIVGSQRAISELIGKYETVGMSPGLRKIGSYDGRERPLDTLTDRQRDVLETAYEMGYYEVPRKASSETVAAELNLEVSTVVEHLQRAERNLLAHHLPAKLRS